MKYIQNGVGYVEILGDGHVPLADGLHNRYQAIRRAEYWIRAGKHPEYERFEVLIDGITVHTVVRAHVYA